LIDDLPQTLLICDSILYQEVYWRKNLYTTNDYSLNTAYDAVELCSWAKSMAESLQMINPGCLRKWIIAANKLIRVRLIHWKTEWTIFDRRIHDKMAIQKLLEEEPCNVGIPNVWSIPDWGAWFKAPRLEHPYKSDLWPPEIRDGNPLREWEDIDKLRE
jgi:hypothetical protein